MDQYARSLPLVILSVSKHRIAINVDVDVCQVTKTLLFWNTYTLNPTPLEYSFPLGTSYPPDAPQVFLTISNYENRYGIDDQSNGTAGKRILYLFQFLQFIFIFSIWNVPRFLLARAQPGGKIDCSRKVLNIVPRKFKSDNKFKQYQRIKSFQNIQFYIHTYHTNAYNLNKILIFDATYIIFMSFI